MVVHQIEDYAGHVGNSKNEELIPNTTATTDDLDI